MKKLIALASIVVLISGCGRKYSRDSSSASSGSGSGNLDPSKLTTVNIKNFNSSTSDFTQLILDLKCPNALPGNNDWKENGVTVTNANPSFSLVKGVACTITLQNYTDLTQSFTPKAAPLILNISEVGIGTLTDPAVEYSKNPSDSKTWYFAANTTSAYAVVLNFGKDPDNVVSEIVNKEMKPISVTAGHGEMPPTVTGLQLTKTLKSNGIDPEYSLFGNATNYDSCKVFKLSDLTNYDYKSINTVFNGSAGKNCPGNLLDGTQGNWSQTASTEGGIIIWAKTGSQFIGYTYVKINANL